MGVVAIALCVASIVILKVRIIEYGDDEDEPSDVSMALSDLSPVSDNTFSDTPDKNSCSDIYVDFESGSEYKHAPPVHDNDYASSQNDDISYVDNLSMNQSDYVNAPPDDHTFGMNLPHEPDNDYASQHDNDSYANNSSRDNDNDYVDSPGKPVTISINPATRR